MHAFSVPAAAAPALADEANDAAARSYFFLTCDSAADLLPRVLIPFTKLNLVPYRIHASTEQGTGEEMSVELRFAGLAPQSVETLAARCRAIIGVRTVMTVNEACGHKKRASLKSGSPRITLLGNTVVSSPDQRKSPGGGAWTDASVFEDGV
ncbi:MAG TPA: hypothetical protein VH858_12530 [Hyphomicrobiales bacterium]